jgi:carbamoyl-phosphate synthase large subunit
MNILITSAGQRVSLVRAFQNELKKIDEQGYVFTTDLVPQLSSACNVSDRYFKVKRVTDTEYIDELLALCKGELISLVIPTIDTELLILAKNKQFFKSEGIDIIISDESFVSICRDKRKSTGFFSNHSIAVPLTVDKANPSFPLFIKPFDGSRSVDTFVIERHEDLTEYHFNEKFLFMEYISRDEYDEYTVDMYFGKDHNVKCIVPRKRISVRAGEVSKALACKNYIVDFLKEKLGYVEGAIGCLTLQLFLNKHNNSIIAIEINPRFGGGYPLSYHAGANFPKWLIQEYFLNHPIAYTDSWEADLLMLRYDDEVIIHGFKS